MSGRDYARSPAHPRMSRWSGGVDMSRRVAVVTGANKGIGLEIARQLGREGITVYLGARDPERGRAAAEKLRSEGIDAHPLPLDVTDDASVSAAATFLEQD